MRVASNSNTMTTAMGTPEASLAIALALGGDVKEAKAALRGVVAIAETTENPHSISIALLAEGLVDRYVDPATALAALRRSLSIAQESGNRFSESHTAVTLSELEVHHGAPAIRVRPPHAGDA